MLILTQHLKPLANPSVRFTLSLTAEERTRSRHQFCSREGELIQLYLPRGTVLRDGDCLLDEKGENLTRVIAQPEPVLTVVAQTPVDLLRAAYHLGNRHVPLEITPTYLRISADAVLKGMLDHLGLSVVEETAPFQPEVGAYSHSH